MFSRSDKHGRATHGASLPTFDYHWSIVQWPADGGHGIAVPLHSTGGLRLDEQIHSLYTLKHCSLEDARLMILSHTTRKRAFIRVHVSPRHVLRAFLNNPQAIVFALFFALSCSAHAQFGGRRGDVVIYALTANGSGAIQVAAAGTTNSSQSAAPFTVIGLDSVPVQSSGVYPSASGPL